MIKVKPWVYLLIIIAAFVFGFWEIGVILILFGIIQIIGAKYFDLDGRSSIFVFAVFVVIIMIILSATGIWDIDWSNSPN